jgi:ABC-type branched-subunit amino acid transport system permease subunit
MSALPYGRLVFGAILAFLVIWAPGGLMAVLSRRPADA